MAAARPESPEAADLSQLRDIGALAAWSVSSSKPNYGVEHLSDPNIKTLWQSEGGQPHLINIQFSKKQSISQISIYADVSQDDSYTPQKISLRAGTYHGDLHEVRWVDLQQPNGWQHLKIGGSARGDDDGGEPIRAHLIQIAIISNHMNGKDTHVRGVRIFAPRQPLITDGLLPFQTVAFKQHETIR
ncbi:anaphase-promoting complex, subunit 10/DOC domain-containing protein [Leucosporidium creatinivorum]|uniref:Anaphase-promoting complex subunit 10 n=1 Tax=Leucosporidium creatinivorum TaxID=106004 RepID=A0A1Y2G3W6_9BASI|nr:anaphase-promoting complex, subunit 10/DOC domain-containing protein [Leucosporidium creatinivorum]